MDYYGGLRGGCHYRGIYGMGHRTTTQNALNKLGYLVRAIAAGCLMNADWLMNNGVKTDGLKGYLMAYHTAHPYSPLIELSAR